MGIITSILRKAGSTTSKALSKAAKVVPNKAISKKLNRMSASASYVGYNLKGTDLARPASEVARIKGGKKYLTGAGKDSGCTEKNCPGS